jgi:hypothetical protein
MVVALLDSSITLKFFHSGKRWGSIMAHQERSVHAQT